MKTETQNKVLEVINQYIVEEQAKVDSLCELLRNIIENGYAPLVDGSNTHGDNMDMREYGAVIRDRIMSIIKVLRLHDFKQFQYYHHDLWDKHFKYLNRWTDLLPR